MMMGTVCLYPMDNIGYKPSGTIWLCAAPQFFNKEGGITPRHSQANGAGSLILCSAKGEIMKRALKDKLLKKTDPMFRAEKMEKEIMENPIEQNSKNLSGVPKSIKARQEKATAQLEKEVEKMEEDMGE